MEEKEIRIKLRIVEQKIEMIEDLIKFNKRTSITLLFICIAVLALVMVIASQKDRMNVMDVFFISSGTSSLYKIMNDMVTERNKTSHELNALKLEEKYYNDLLKED